MNSPYEWSYLLDPRFARRYAEIGFLIKESDRVLDVGTVRSRLRDELGDQREVSIVSCDLEGTLLESEHKDDKFFCGRLSELVRRELSDLNPSVVIAMGLNLVGLKPQSDQPEFEAFVELASGARLVIIEYPVDFFRARLEAEAVISLLGPRILLEKSLDFSGVAGVPPHAQRRRLIAFEPTKNFDRVEANRLFGAVFGRLATSKSPSMLRACSRNGLWNFEPCNGSQVRRRFNGVTVSAASAPWSYVVVAHPKLALPEDSYVWMKVRQRANLLNIATMLNDNLTFETRIQDINDRRFGILLKRGERLLLRYGQHGGFESASLRIEGMSPI